MITSDAIRMAIQRHYSNLGCAVAFEVAHGTGRHANRHVDAVVFDLWPSRGLRLHAIEIKVSRSDLKRELKDGSKAEEIAQHCDVFSIAAPKGIAKADELPASWGLIELNGDGLLRHAKMPKETEALPVDRHFMAALVRAVGKGPARDLAGERRKVYEEIYKGFDEEVRRRADNARGDGAKWAKLVGELESKGVRYHADNEIVEAVALVLKAGVASSYAGVRAIEAQLAKAAEIIKEAADALGLPEHKKKI